MTDSPSQWAVLVVFDDGESRYFKRLDSATAEELTRVADDAQRYDSAAEAMRVAYELKKRYRRVVHVDVEERVPDSSDDGPPDAS